MKVVNQSFGKVDGVGLIMGSPVYTEDLAPKDALVVKVLRSPHAFAKMKAINVEEARSLPGVECILTYQDIPRIPFTRAGQAYPEASPYDKFILDEYVRHIGDDVAIVAARTEEIAEKALKSIKVEYEVLEPVLDFEKAVDHSSIIHPEQDLETSAAVGFYPERNIAGQVEITMGNVEEVLKECEVVVRGRYYSQAQAQVMMETFRTATYFDHYGRLVVISSTQIPFHIRRFLARTLELPIGKIRVIKPRIGGGYGAKQTAQSEFYPALVTLKTGKPAMIIYSRQECFEAGNSRHPMRLDVTIGSDNSGKIKAIEIEGISDTGAYGEHAYAVFLQAGLKSINLYNKVEAARFGGKAVYTNHTPSGAFRGYGATQGINALESAVNELAHKLGIDPSELREKNMIKKGETALKFDFNGQKSNSPAEIMDSCALDYCVSKGEELIGWQEKFPRQKVSANKVRGVGMALARQGSGIANVDMGSATIKFNEDGSFMLLVGATDIGTGSDTILSQICAEELGVNFEKVNVYSSDTDLTPFDSGAYASSTTYVSGNAVKKAAATMKELVLREGARQLGLSADRVEFDGNVVKTAEDGGEEGNLKTMSLEDLAKKLMYSQKQLVATESFVGHKSPPPYMAGFAEVEVDLETGKVDLLNYVGVLDVGTVVNPTLARIQAEGGIAQGIGLALFEEVKVSEKGKLMTNNLMQYKVPTRCDYGNIIVDFAESYEPSGPFGAKSIGEVVTNTPAPAIADAIFNATGVRIRELPITPEKLMLELLKQREEKALLSISK